MVRGTSKDSYLSADQLSQPVIQKKSAPRKQNALLPENYHDNEATFEFDASEGFSQPRNFDDFGSDDAAANLEMILAAQKAVVQRRQ